VQLCARAGTDCRKAYNRVYSGALDLEPRDTFLARFSEFEARPRKPAAEASPCLICSTPTFSKTRVCKGTERCMKARERVRWGTLEIEPEMTFRHRFEEHEKRNQTAAQLLGLTPAEYKANKLREQARESRKRRRKAAKLKALEKYGAECVCCGETDPEELTVDHVRGDGSSDRSVRDMWNKLASSPVTEYYQVLCKKCKVA